MTSDGDDGEDGDGVEVGIDVDDLVDLVLVGSTLTLAFRPGLARSGITHCLVGLAKTIPDDDEFSFGVDDMVVGVWRDGGLMYWQYGYVCWSSRGWVVCCVVL